jgi:Homing endonuclease associated repeat
LQQVADDFDLSRQRVSQIVRDTCPDWDGTIRRAAVVKEDTVVVPGRVVTGGRPRVWTQQMILDALREAAVSGSAPSVGRWKKEKRSPSPAVIVTRYGSWNSACLAAGLEVTPAPRGMGGLSDAELVAGVAAFLADPVARMRGVRGYAVWAREHGFPSPSMLRGRFGSWSAVVTAVSSPTGLGRAKLGAVSSKTSSKRQGVEDAYHHTAHEEEAGRVR